MQLDYIRNQKLIKLECISGSKAYGLDTPTSDTDIKGVFIVPKKVFYGLSYPKQINNPTNDIAFYELGRFIELLAVNNPNILELLNTPSHAILFKHPFLSAIKPTLFLSKLCKDTFGKFALSQIKKAKGLNKKIVNPIGKERKSILAFCYVNYQNGSMPLLDFLALKNWEQAHCGLVNIANMPNIYGLYYSGSHDFNGIAKKDTSNDISLSSIPKEIPQEALLYFNRNGYSTYCKEYKNYWEWVAKRNAARYENTQSHGKNYDAKNMMHTFRLLDMAIEIAKEHRVNVKRPNRAFLLQIKSGHFEYEDLLKMANEKQLEMEAAFEKTDLPEKPNLEAINELAYNIRNRFYND